MKKGCILLAALACSGSLLSQNPIIERAQSNTVTTISMDEIGKIKIVTPNDILAGDKFTAGVKLIPEGKKEKDIVKNNQILKDSYIYLGHTRFPASGNSGPLFLSESEIRNTPIKVTDPGGKTLFESIVPDLFNKPIPKSTGFKIPSHGVIGTPFRIYGNFDGNAQNTSCHIGGKPAEILAESPRQCIIEFPNDIKGATSITISENGIIITEQIGAVDMSISAGRMNLKRGESTYVDVVVTGLENLKENATLTVKNVSTAVVTMGGGNSQVITILPAAVSGTGNFNQRFNIQSLHKGTFSINIDLQLPEPGEIKNKE